MTKMLPLRQMITIVAMIALISGFLFNPTADAAPDQGWSKTADVTWDVQTADPGVRHTGTIRALVWDMEELNGRMYVAGKFLEVRSPGGDVFDQPYLAAFDLETGAWIDSFRPVVDGTVYAMDVTDDGRLLVGGELTGGVAAYNLPSGSRDNSFSPGITNSWGPPSVFDVEVLGSEVFVGGTFTAAQGTALRNLAKLNVNSGALDTSWLPTADLDAGTPQLAGSLVWGMAIDPGRDRLYLAGKFGGINGDDTASYFATLDPGTGQLRTDVPQGLPTEIPNHRERWSMWMHDVQFKDNKVYIGGQGHQTIIMDAANLTLESSHFTNRGVGDTYAGGDTQVIFVGETTVWSGCHCWGSVGPYPLGDYIADPGGLQTYAEYAQWVADFRDINPNGQQKVRGGFGIEIASQELVPLTFDLGGQAGAYAIVEDSNGRVWFGGQYTRDPITNRKITGIARFSPLGDDAGGGPTGLRTTVQTRERIVLNWQRLDGSSSYEILRGGAVVGSTGGTWFTDNDLDEGTSYDYTVRGVLPDGSRTPPSATLTVSTLGGGGGTPASVASCTVTEDGGNLNVSWPVAANAADYRVYRSVDGGNVYWRGKVTASPFGDTDRNGTLVYTVISVAADNSTVSAPTTCTNGDGVGGGGGAGGGGGEAPAAPANCAVALVGDSIEVTWPTAANAADYIVRRNIDGGTDYWRGKVSTTSFTDSNRDGTIQYRVSSKGADGVESAVTTCTPTLP